MIALPQLLLALTVFLFIALLPKIFFRKDGRFNLMWFITGTPYFIAIVAVFLDYQALIPRLAIVPEAWLSSAQALGSLLLQFSFGLICLTLGTHRVPLALWHQTNDAPQHIVTWGAYRYIRHPFYSSFLLFLSACLILSPNYVSLFAFVYGLIMMNTTAAREEKRLSLSAFGAEYLAYKAKTGRFIPGL